MLGWTPAITFVNARVVTEHGEARSVRFSRHIVEVDGKPGRRDFVVDLDGRFVLPGLINAHDHLELNHYGLLKKRPKYQNAGEWIGDLEQVVRRDPKILAGSRIPLRDRLFAGGLKNLLSGVTTVAHHNPLYRAIGRRFPVAVLRRFGWAHSLGLETGPAGANGEPGGSVADRYASTPADAPFIVHAAEGVDAVAADEIDALESRACLQPNTVLVHAVAVPASRWGALFARGVSVVWCPASNVFLFGETLGVPGMLKHPHARSRICLGTDSRLTGSRDLLDELRVAGAAGVGSADLLPMVTSSAADILRMSTGGRMRRGAAADLLVLPASADDPAAALVSCDRADVDLVVRAGTPIVGSADLASVFAQRRVSTAQLIVDGQAKLAHVRLVERIRRCQITEPGVSVAGGA
jgi:cytosine/adenosine deaminase-related metal-dependent hydrolase